MKNIQNLFILLVLLLAANGCTKFDDLEADPNRPNTVPPSLVLRGVLKDLYYAPWSDEQRWNQYWCSNYNYYDNNEYWNGSADLRYTTLKNVQKMEDEAARVGLPAANSFASIAPFFRAYFFYDMTMKVGDVPLSEALKGVDQVAPAYDSQVAVFKQILTWLDEANTKLGAQIAAGQTLQDKFYFTPGDFYFNGDLAKWQKTVNAFHLRVLVQMSKRSDDLNYVHSEFAKIMDNPAQYPLMDGNSDNLQFRFNSVNDKYPFNPDNFGFYADRYNTSATYVNTLAALKDPRVFKVAEPAAAKLAAGFTAQDFEAYVGAPSDEGLDEMATKVQAGEYSRISKARYFSSYEGEPSIQIGYAEMCFNIAEGIAYDWWPVGDAKAWYDKGVTASMNSYGITDGALIGAYLARPETGYQGKTPDGLKQILVQKYLAMAQHSGLEAYFNWRRTGQPHFFQGGPGTGNSGVIPRRFQYPNSERDNNTANYRAALQRQFNKTDDSVNEDLWIVQ